MALFAISDPHLSLATDKPMDIFPGWGDYVRRLEDNWRAIITDDDTVVIAGDISWAMKLEDTATDFDFINRLPGRKILMKGNHDLWWNSVSKMNAYLEQNGFDTLSILHNSCVEYGDYAICGSRGWFYDAVGEHDKKILNRELGRIRTSLEAGVKTGKTPLMFLHYPPLTIDSVCEEITALLGEFGISRCYYGHIHRGGGYKAFNGEHEGVRYRCISCDMMDFVPLLIV